MGVILTAVMALLLFSGWLYLVQPSMLFYPYADLQETPAAWHLEYEEVALTTRDGISLHGWYIPSEGASEVVLFFHGNAGNISHRGESIRIFNRLGLNVLIFDYRGYGKSGGTPDEQGLYEDARAAWVHLVDQREFSQDQIILFGRSLGAAVATQLAEEVQPALLILESAFSSVRDMARRHMPVASRITFMRYDFDSVPRIGRINSRLLMLHSPEDEIAPIELGRKIFDAANEPKQFVKLRGDHNTGFILSQPEYEQELGKFLRGRGRFQ